MYNKNRIEYLESLMPKTCIDKKTNKTMTVDEKYSDSFSKYAVYLGNGVYSWRGIVSTDTQELYMLVVLRCEGIDFEEI